MTVRVESKSKSELPELLTFRLVFDVIDQQVRECEARDKWGKARQVVVEAKNRFERMPKGKWRKRYLEELERRHTLYFSGEIVPLEVKQAVALENAASRDEDQFWEMLLAVTDRALRGDPYD